MKARYFKHLLRGGDPDAERVYLWHIAVRSGARMEQGLTTDRWKRSLDDYLSSAKALFCSMGEKGFDPKCAVPIDPDGELLDGSHRVACALALKIEQIPIVRKPQRAWASAWDEASFIAADISAEDLGRLRQDWRILNGPRI